MAKIYGVYVVLAFATWLRDEAVTHHFGQEVWRIVDFVPSWSFSTWIIIALTTLLAFALEGSYRHARLAEQAHVTAIQKELREIETLGTRLSDKNTEILTLTKQLQTQAPPVEMGMISTPTYHGIAVENRSSERDAYNVTAELLNCDGYALNFERLPSLRTKCSSPLKIISFKIPTEETPQSGGITAFAIAAFGHTDIDTWPVCFMLRLTFSDAFASYSRLVTISSHWPAFGLGRDVEIIHQPIMLQAARAITDPQRDTSS